MVKAKARDLPLAVKLTGTILVCISKAEFACIQDTSMLFGQRER